MQIYARDYIEHRDQKFYVNGRERALDKDEPKDYRIRRTTESPAIDLSKGPALVTCMGIFQTEDMAPRSVGDISADLESGRMPYLKMFLDKLAPGRNLRPVLIHLSDGLERMCRGYFRMTDEALNQPALQMPPVSSYVVSYESAEERAKVLMHDLQHVDQNRYFTTEAVDFVNRVIAPYLGEEHAVVREADGEHIEIRNRKPIQDIVKCTQNLVLLGNSSGTNFIVEVENALTDTLKRAQFSKEDTRKIMRSVRAIGLGQLADYESLKGPRFTSVFFEGINDLVAQATNPHKITLTEEDIRRYCPPRQQEMLIKAAHQHYEQMNHAFDNPQDQADAGLMALTDKQLFIPRPQGDSNRMLVLSSVPTNRTRWTINDLLRRSTRGMSGRGRGDPQTERIFYNMLEDVGKDKNGHHMAFLITQGNPPSYLVQVVHNVLLNMLAFPSLPENEKKQFEAADFMTRNLQRHNLDHDAGSVMQKDLLMEPVRYGLECARKSPAGAVFR